MGKETKITATWQGKMSFVAEDESGGKAQLGSLEGRPGIAPMSMMLASLAACTGVDVAHILGKKRAKLHDLKVEVRAKQAEKHPKVYTEINVMYLLWGEDLNPKDIEQAIELSETKYCSASIMLKCTAEIHSAYRIFAPGESPD